MMKIEDIQLKNTVNMMISDDYQDRFRAEFWQTAVRYRKLSVQLADWDQSPFIHETDRKTLERQAELMAGLIYIYLKRAVLERVDLFEGDFSPFPVFKDSLESLKGELEEKKQIFVETQPRIMSELEFEKKMFADLDRGKKS